MCQSFDDPAAMTPAQRRREIAAILLAGLVRMPPAGRNEKKAAFIEEQQVGPESLRLFLYAATCSASNEQRPLGPVGSLVARVLGTTTLHVATVARRDWDGTPHRIPCGSRSGFVSASTDRSESRMPMLLPGEAPRVAGIRPLAACADDPEPVWPSARPGPRELPSVAIGTQRRTRRGRAARPPSDSSRDRAMPSLVVGGAPMPSAILWVSSIIYRHSACIASAKRYNNDVGMGPQDHTEDRRRYKDKDGTWKSSGSFSGTRFRWPSTA